MDVNISACIHCAKPLHYAEAKLLPEGGGVCPACAQTHGYTPCEECQDYFIPDEQESICEICLERIFAREEVF